MHKINDIPHRTKEEYQAPLAAISFTFDDGRLSTYTNAFPLLRDAGLVGHIAVVTDKVGCPGFYDWDQITEMAAAGWEVESHTCSHNLADLTTEKCCREVVESKAVLMAHGHEVNIFSFPGGLWQDQPHFSPNGYFEQTVRKTYAGYLRIGVPHPMRSPVDPYQLGYLCCECYESEQWGKPIDAIRNCVDQTIAAGAWCNLLWHDINDRHLPKFRQAVQYAAEQIRTGRLRCVTSSDYLHL
jgi:peptidoglycan/xylan/chitin deacetylase (PgdA/CDA1 family)